MEIIVNSLKKKYGQTPILDIGELTFSESSVTGIMGPNGTGKTTLMRILAGLDTDYDGEILYDGKKYTNELQRRITMSFQKPLLLRGTVRKNLEYPLMLRKIEKRQRESQIIEVMDAMGISGLCGKNALTLSGGEAQKVALARAIIIKPEVLMLDEPLSAVDFDSVPIIERAIKEFGNKTGATIIMITHNRDEAERLCDSIVHLKKGRNGGTNGVFEGNERSGGPQAY